MKEKRKEKKIKKKANPVAIIISVVLLSISAVFLYKAGSEFAETVKLNKQIEEATALLANVKKENVELSEQKTKLEDPEYVKSYARGTYMLSKEGEQIFYLPSEDE